ncbi:hypothetical protein [Bradyrhizobium erythrophlei]|uniref:hypothetical protein n=1 Tax=Bradyrhizobium erythrophlei TaxID=1437360 RepID=UPI0011600A19|nr:hypothetical protein [Bradyrhizobium erythrophlei]
MINNIIQPIKVTASSMNLLLGANSYIGTAGAAALGILAVVAVVFPSVPVVAPDCPSVEGFVERVALYQFSGDRCLREEAIGRELDVGYPLVDDPSCRAAQSSRRFLIRKARP